MDRRTVERWSAALGAIALVGTFCVYVNVWVTPRYYSGELEAWTRAIVDGTAAAPYQYRILVPAVLVWLTDHARLSLAQATILVDGSALAVGTAFGFRLLRHAGLAMYALPAAMYAGYLGIGLLFFPKPETLVSFAALTAAMVVLASDAAADSAWLLLAIAALVLAGCRTDLLLALGAGFGERWRERRKWADLVAAGSVVALAVVATVALAVRYSGARYPEGVSTFQVLHNIRPLPIVMAAAFLAPALGPLLLARTPFLRSEILTVVRDCGPLLAVLATEIGVTLLVGRVDEVRLLFPLAFPIAVVGIQLWSAVVRSIERAGTPVA